MSAGRSSRGVVPQGSDSLADSSGSAEPALLSVLSEIAVEVARAGSSSIDLAITRALAKIVSIAQADGAFLYLFSSDRRTVTVTHRHYDPGLQVHFPPIRDMPIELYPSAFRLVLDGQVVDAPDIDDVPDASSGAVSAMRAFGLRGVVSVPLIDAEDILGGVGFTWFEKPGRTSPAMLSVLRTVGQIFAGALVRARADADLSEVEQRIRSFIATTTEAISCYESKEGVDVSLSIDEQFDRLLDAVLVECNAVYAAMRRADRASLLGRPLRDLSLESLDVLRTLYRDLASKGFVAEGLELTQVMPNGSRRYVVANVRGVIEDGRLRRVWIVMRDVTRQREAEERQKSLEAQLRQIQKLDSIGLLAGGIAHDFNNLLLVTSSYATLARTAHDEGRTADLLDALARIEQASARGAELTQQLLAFSKQQPIDRQPVEVDDRVRATVALLGRLVPASVSLELRLGCGGVVIGDPSQLDQILVNLVVNAVDSVGDKGHVSIETSEVTLCRDANQVRAFQGEGKFALITVKDDGRGMPPEVCERIFEPFFTTKGPKKGTGLGLSVVYGVVQQHGGDIRVESAPGAGTTFRVYLPLGERGQARSPRSPPRIRSAYGSETILLAEDHGLVRDLVTKLLERAGYRVLAAKDGAEAKQLFDRHARDVDLLIVDAVMPFESGAAVLEHVRAARPAIPVILSSGYSMGAFDETPEDASTHVVPKPYEADALLRTVRAALDARSS